MKIFNLGRAPGILWMGLLLIVCAVITALSGSIQLAMLQALASFALYGLPSKQWLLQINLC
jgi:hypothetical protein